MSQRKNGQLLQIILSLGLILAMASAAGAKPKAGKEPVAAKPPETAPEKGSYRGPGALGQLIAALDKARALSRKANEDPDLTAKFLDAIARTSLVTAIHGHYAFAGLGQAMRTGGMPAADVRAYASDMQQNYRGMAESYADLAKVKAFDQTLKDIFASLQLLCEYADKAAAGLVNWSDKADDPPRAAAFEAALEAYRGRVKSLVLTVSGGDGK